MRTLFVMPVQEGSGETVTTVQVAQQLHDIGWPVAFLASEFALRFVPAHIAAHHWVLANDGPTNVITWEQALRTFKPDVVLFADYPLMLFNHGVAPLAREGQWVQDLSDVDAELITFDHFGWAQRTEPLFLGPPHLGLSAQQFEPLPRRLKTLRPCPMHDPHSRPTVAGEPFRSCQLPLKYSRDKRRRVRDTWLGSGNDRFLVFHSVPTWAWRHAERLQLALYEILPGLLETYFGPLADRVTVVSSNSGELLAQDRAARMQIINVGSLPVEKFQDLLLGADLVLSENGLSISLGKAVCAQQISVVLHNSFTLSELIRRANADIVPALNFLERRRPGAVFPFAAFPTVTPADVEAIGLFRDNSLAECFARLEIFGGAETADSLQRLLVDEGTRDALYDRQQAYIDKLARLDEVPAIVARVAAGA